MDEFRVQKKKKKRVTICVVVLESPNMKDLLVFTETSSSAMILA